MEEAGSTNAARGPRAALLVVLFLLRCGGTNSTPPPSVAAPELTPCPPIVGINVPTVPDAACPSASDVATIRREIPIEFEPEGGTPETVCAASVSGEPLTRRKRYLLRGLDHMRRLRFDAPLPWTSQTLYDWFRGTVAGIRVRDGIPYSFCCEPAAVINIKYQTEPFDDRIVPVLPLRVLVHEARHVETGAHTCGTTRDMRIAELGAFGVEYHLLLYLAGRETSGLGTPEYRQYARVSAENVRVMGFCFECARGAAGADAGPSGLPLLFVGAAVATPSCPR